MLKQDASSAILERLAAENRQVLSAWRAFLLLRRATFTLHPDVRRWTILPQDEADIYPLLRRMQARGELTPLPKLVRLYQVTVPYARIGPIQEDEVLMEANPYAAISHLSALVYHGLSNDLPQESIAAIPARRIPDLLPMGTRPEDWVGLPHVDGSRPMTILHQRMRWLRIPPERYFGMQEYRPHGYPVRVTTPERTLVDGLQDPSLCGGLDKVLQAWSRARDTVDLDDLIEIVERLQIAVLRQRVGFVLDQLRLQHPRVEAWRAGAKRGGSSKLIADLPYAPHYSERWSLSINAPVDILTEGLA